MAKIMLNFKWFIIIFIFVLTLLANDNIVYGQTDEGENLGGERIEKIINLQPLSYYERSIGIRKILSEEIVVPPIEGFRITHHLETTVSETYDNNIYGDTDNEIDDFITSISPTFRLDFFTGRLYLNTAYKLTTDYYQDLNNELFNWSTAARARYQFSPRIRFEVQDIYQKSNSLKQLEGIDLLPSGHTVERTDSNAFFSQIEYDLIRGGNKLWATYNRDNSGVFIHGRNNDIQSYNQKAGAGFTHSFSRRTSISPAYTFHKFNNRKNELSDYEANGLALGFNHSVSNLLKGSGKVGVEKRDYGKRGEKDDTFNASIGLTSLFSRRIKVEADYAYDTFSSYVSTDEYEQNAFGERISYLFTPSVSAGVSSAYTVDNYESGKEINVFDVGTDFSVTTGNRLVTTLSYKYSKKNSTVETEEYIDNVFMVIVKMILW